MKNSYSYIALLIVLSPLLLYSCGDKTSEFSWSTGEWDADSLGYHRVVLKVTDRTDALLAHINWRRRDKEPEKKGFILVDGKTDRRIENVIALDINRESGDILFQPQTVPGNYYLYYLPGKPARKSNYPRVKYPEPFKTADSAWSNKYEISSFEKIVADKNIKRARVVLIQSRDSFNSFYPMEVIATKAETEDLIRQYPGKIFLLFTEDRSLSIRMKEDLPRKWISDKPQKPIKAVVAKGEYFTFQLGVYPVKDDMKDIKVTFSDLTGSDGSVKIKSSELTCYNTSGRDWDGTWFLKQVDVNRRTVQAIWCGIMIPELIDKGILKGTVTVTSEEVEAQSAPIEITVTDKSAVNHGDNDPYSMTRLRWLNSGLAFNDDVIQPFTAIRRAGTELSILGRKVIINESGLPEKYLSYFSPDVTNVSESGKDILASPVAFSVTEDIGTPMIWKNKSMSFTRESTGLVAWRSENNSAKLDMNVDGALEADGFAQLKIMLIAREEVLAGNIHLYIPVSKEFSSYMMGLGLRGGLRPSSHSWKWNRMLHQEGAWIGGVNGGIQFALRDNKYVRPLNTNFYREKPLVMPQSWCNDGKGGINITSGKTSVLIDNFSGPRDIKKGDTLYFYVNLLLTPFKTIETDRQWETRFYHSYKPVDTIMKYGANTINIHHANEINPWINYPFLEPVKMKAYIDEAHSKGMKVKIYNTVRELSNHAPELFAIRSLGHEIFSPGPGNGFNWLQEHLGDDYIAAWFVPDLKDAAIINSGMSRWHNYYIEGMNWLTKEVGIDGLYLDDVAFDRTTMKRLRKVLDANRQGALIDLHSANQYNERDGFTNSACLYLEHFPYLNRLWFGEYFDRNLPPDFWLVEMSGIPFGLMGEMLQDGGNQYRGMLYGMTARAPWSGDPSALWKAWDNFGMKGTLMTGYWSENCPVRTNYPTIPATVYRKDGMAMIAIASWDNQTREVKLNIDWKKLGIDKISCELIIPSIRNFQENQLPGIDETITIRPAEGKIIIIKSKQ